jgi:hypothetical protein
MENRGILNDQNRRHFESGDDEVIPQHQSNTRRKVRKRTVRAIEDIPEAYEIIITTRGNENKFVEALDVQDIEATIEVLQYLKRKKKYEN